MLFIYDSCFDKVFGKLIDDLAAMLVGGCGHFLGD